MATGTRQYGIITTTTGVTSIVVNSYTKSESSEIAEARDEKGQVIDFQAYSKGTTLNIKGLLNAATCSISAGALLTLDSVNYIVESCEIAETNTGFVEVTISAKTADAATIHAYTAPTA